jgi:hypothetical protein
LHHPNTDKKKASSSSHLTIFLSYTNLKQVPPSIIFLPTPTLSDYTEVAPHDELWALVADNCDTGSIKLDWSLGKQVVVVSS